MAPVSHLAKRRPAPQDWDLVPASHPALRGGEPVALRMSDGAILRGEWCRPKTPPRAVVALSHAMMVDRRTLDRPAGQGLLSALVENGIEVFWFDQRGHGQSGPTAASGSRWDFDTLVCDGAAIAAYLEQAAPSLPRVAVGHSLFGNVALAWQTQALDLPNAARFDGLVLVASNVWLRDHEPLAGRWLRKRITFESLLLLTRPLGYFPSVRLGTGSDDEPLPYLAQMGSWVFGRDWTDRHGRSYRTKLGRIRVPILSVAGAGDTLMAVPGCQFRFVSETSGPITHWQLGRRFGDPIDPDHMSVVMSPSLRPRFDDIAAWITTPGRFAPAANGGQP